MLAMEQQDISEQTNPGKLEHNIRRKRKKARKKLTRLTREKKLREN